MGKLEDDEAERVRCAECGREVEEAEAQAARWGYWRDGRGAERYPYCPGCAERAFGAGE